MIISQNGKEIKNVGYRKESDLQEVIHNHPELLNYKNKLSSVGCEINTDAGRVDVLMVSDKGEIVIVEVKLKKNGESRRQVVAQIIDYLSAFTQYSYHALDEITENELSRIVDDEENAAELAKKIDEDLRCGAITLIIAVDEANKDLRRIVDFLSMHSYLRIYLVEVKRLQNSDESIIYSSNTLVEPSEELRGEQVVNHNLEVVCEQWDKLHPNLKTCGSNVRFRKIHIPKWPGALHYEFYAGSNKSLDVRLDLELPAESTLCKKVAEVLGHFVGEKINNYSVERHMRRTGDIIARILIPIPVDKLDDAASVMDELIKLTREAVDKVVRKS